MRLQPKSDWKDILARANKSSPVFVSAGGEYVAYGLSWPTRSLFEPGCICTIVDDDGHLVSAPLAIFEIIDDRCSSTWRVRKGVDGSVFMWPEAFYAEFFFDDLSEGFPEVVSAFKAAKSLMDAEHV